MRSVLEWLLALGVLAAVVWVVAPVVIRWLPLVDDPITLVESASPAMPRGIPDSAESMPFLMLPDGTVVRVGAEERTLRPVIARWLASAPETEDGVFGERHIAAYRIENSRFWVIFERTAPNTERRVTAIYVQ